MDLVLSERLPPELVDKIAREVHRLNFKGCLSQIKYCIYRVSDDLYQMSNWNYWQVLSMDCDDDDSLLEEIIIGRRKNL